MGDLAADTSVRRAGDGTFRATLSRDWEIWGPMGGYVSACALRAVGAEEPDRVPATFSCHFLAVAEWGDVDIALLRRRETRGASSFRIELSQAGRPVLDAMVWSVSEGQGLEHDEASAPDVPAPDDLPLMTELAPAGVWPPFPLWTNLDAKPAGLDSTWPPSGPGPAVWRQWVRFRPAGTFDDPWVDAARSVILTDLGGWPAIQMRHGWRRPPYVALTLDLNVSFHRPAGGYDWLLVDGAAPVSTGGRFAWTTGVWSEDRVLRASGGGQCKYRRLRS
jgi:acyl-CoA thioesterase-2